MSRLEFGRLLLSRGGQGGSALHAAEVRSGEDLGEARAHAVGGLSISQLQGLFLLTFEFVFAVTVTVTVTVTVAVTSLLHHADGI